MRPKICVPIVAPLRDGIIRETKQIAKLPVEMVEWRIDFYAGYEREILDVITELKRVLNEKELLVTIRTVAEGGEKNGSRFDYFETIRKILEQQTADYVDVEAARDEEKVKALCQKYSNSKTKVIGSYHDFSKTPSADEIKERLCKAKECGCYAGKLACMPKTREDVDTLLNATAAMKEEFPDFPLITMSMGELGKVSRLYGGLYGSFVSFGCVSEASAPGQVYYETMCEVFDKIYKGNRQSQKVSYIIRFH